MRSLGIVGGLAVIAGTFVLGLFVWRHGVETLCKPDESCVREWIAATSGWMAVVVAIPTILYLSKQVRDADRHQRTSFGIELRRQRILAPRTSLIANTTLYLIQRYDEGVEEGCKPDIRSWDKETVDGIIHHLRDTTLAAFESEIAHPIGLGASATALVVEKAYAGIEPAVHSGPAFTKEFFENLRTQAEEYLSEVRRITGDV